MALMEVEMDYGFGLVDMQRLDRLGASLTDWMNKYAADIDEELNSGEETTLDGIVTAFTDAARLDREEQFLQMS